MAAPPASRGKSWVLAMLALQEGLRVAPVPPKAADLTRLPRGRRDIGRSGRRNRRFGQTKEQPRAPRGLAATIVCRLQSSHPMVGETEHASHTEIRTLPRPMEPHLSTHAKTIPPTHQQTVDPRCIPSSRPPRTSPSCAAHRMSRSCSRRPPCSACPRWASPTAIPLAGMVRAHQRAKKRCPPDRRLPAGSDRRAVGPGLPDRPARIGHG